MQFLIYKKKTFSFFLEVNSPKFYIGLILALLFLFSCFHVGASVAASVVLPGLFLALSVFRIECNETGKKLLCGLWGFGTPIVVLFLTQLLMNVGLSQVGLLQVVLGLLCVSVVLLFLYICTMNCRAAVIGTVLLLMGLTIVNYFVVRFRGSELAPADFLAIRTALDVAGEYNYSANPPFVYACCLAVAYCFFGFSFQNFRCNHTLKKVCIYLAIEVIMIVSLITGINNTSAYHFATSGSLINGFFVNFLCRFKTALVNIPDDYNAEAIQEIENEYAENTTISANKPSDIIVIMGESYSDLRVVGNLKTDAEVMPFFDSLTENTVRGYALTSVFGGGTCNSEYEVLTGNTLAFLPDSTYPYQQYIKGENYSLASCLGDLGYATVATHPNIGGNWMRSTAWPRLGFDEDRYIEEYAQNNLMRGYVSDLEMYQQIISWYEQRDTDKPFFLFGVTMQNHGPFDYSGSDFKSTIHLTGYSKEYPDVEQYLTLINCSDQALEYLISYFETAENNVVIVFFGDHQPQIDSAFYDELHQGSFDTLEEKMLLYMVPFVIWANYDIEEQFINYTSLNFLSNYIYAAAGIELPAYNAFLQDVNGTIPAINTFGFYSNMQRTFVSLEDATGIEAEMLHKYQLLQYNSLFDADNRSRIFFPLS